MFLDNLPPGSSEILESIWAINTVTELDSYLKTLDEEELQKTLVLIEMCQLAQIDDDVEKMKTYSDANTLLNNILK
jgi:hypothetical protein